MLHLIIMLNTMKILIKNEDLEIGDYVKILKYKNIFATGYTENWTEEVFVISKIKNTVPWTYW